MLTPWKWRQTHVKEIHMLTVSDLPKNPLAFIYNLEQPGTLMSKSAAKLRICPLGGLRATRPRSLEDCNA